MWPPVKYCICCNWDIYIFIFSEEKESEWDILWKRLLGYGIVRKKCSRNRQYIFSSLLQYGLKNEQGPLGKQNETKQNKMKQINIQKKPVAEMFDS